MWLLEFSGDESRPSSYLGMNAVMGDDVYSGWRSWGAHMHFMHLARV